MSIITNHYSQMLKNKKVCVPSVFPRIKKALTKLS